MPRGRRTRRDAGMASARCVASADERGGRVPRKGARRSSHVARMQKSHNRRIRGMTSGRVFERFKDIARAIVDAEVDLRGATATRAHLRSSDPCRPRRRPPCLALSVAETAVQKKRRRLRRDWHSSLTRFTYGISRPETAHTEPRSATLRGDSSPGFCRDELEVRRHRRRARRAREET